MSAPAPLPIARRPQPGPAPGAKWLGTAGRIMGLQLVLGGLTYFLYDWRGLSLAGGLLFLWESGRIVRRELSDRPGWQVWAAAVFSQLPGLVGSANVLLVQLGLYRQSSFGDLLDFVMETWHTVLLPWATLLPNRRVVSFSGELLVLFFIALPFLSPLLVGWLGLAGTTRPGAGRKFPVRMRQTPSRPPY